VRFSDWIRRDYAAILAARVEKGAIARLRDLLETEGHAPSVLETLPIDLIIETLFPPDRRGKSATRASKARDAGGAVKLCRECGANLPLSPEVLGDLEDLELKGAVRLREECIQDRLADYQFLSHIDADGDHDGFVVLLRQVYHLHWEMAGRVSGGLDLPPAPASHGLLANSGYAAPVGEIQSPFLELLMQRFAILFSRIGVPDVRSEYSTQFTSEVGRRD
jgi:hypothetical protein